MNKVLLVFTVLALANPLQANHLSGRRRKREEQKRQKEGNKKNNMTSVAKFYIQICYMYVYIV